MFKMKHFAVAALLAVKAASQTYYWWPYDAPITYAGYTGIYSYSERISEVKIYKGANGCLSGLALRSHSGTETYDYAAGTSTQAPAPESCSSNTLCLSQSLSDS